jgi:hypothetical protein
MSQATQMTITELNDRFRQHNLGHGQVRIAPMVEMMPIASLAPEAIECHRPPGGRPMNSAPTLHLLEIIEAKFLMFDR